MKRPIIDLHCDLLSYLAEGNERTPFDDIARCSLTQLKEGGVVCQVLAIFTETETGSSSMGQKQANLLPEVQSQTEITLIPAVENASAFAEENEPLEEVLKRFDKLPPLAYMSLTWNGENRFGGGCGSDTGLHRDGEVLLEWMNEMNIPIDLSHTSDFLASDILNFLDKKNLSLTPIASHSNFRAICERERNLPDEFAKEIKERGGIIGLNLCAPFVGTSIKMLGAHLQHAEKLGLNDSLVFGADFFGGLNFQTSFPPPLFFDEASDASCYPYLIETFGISSKIAFETARDFLKLPIFGGEP